jgi:hypothetical protein
VGDGAHAESYAVLVSDEDLVIENVAEFVVDAEGRGDPVEEREEADVGWEELDAPSELVAKIHSPIWPKTNQKRPGQQERTNIKIKVKA